MRDEHNQPFREYIEPVRLSDSAARRSRHLDTLPPPASGKRPLPPAPGDDDCMALWDKYVMPEHIRAHSLVVAAVATALAEKAVAEGAKVDVPSVRASGLLHDLGKIYTLRNGGSHGQVGGAWVVAETRNPHIAQGVVMHTRWIWPIDETVDAWLLPFFIIYADKRVMHNTVVNTQDRFKDLLERYGHTEEAKKRIAGSHQQGLDIEAALSRRLRIPLHEYTFDSGRLVKRT